MISNQKYISMIWSLVGKPDSAEPKGAIGKLLLCLSNTRDLKDPITSQTVQLGESNCEDHHIIARKFVPSLANWQGRHQKYNLALNIMRTTSEPNKDYSNGDPKLQVQKSLSVNGDEKTKDLFSKHFISSNMLEIIKKNDKNADDYLQFILLRQHEFESFIREEFATLDKSKDDVEEAEVES